MGIALDKRFFEKMPDWLVYLISAVAIGIAAFLCVHGISPLDVTNDQWLFTAEDLNQHYLGWRFYRTSDWHMPIGLIDGLTIEPISVMFTDSIPLFAIFFKTISFILPDTFQYFGIWGLCCYILQTFFAMLLLHPFSKNKCQSIIGSLLFTVSPVVLNRIFDHSALGANWLVLAALALWINKDRIKSLKKRVVVWTVLMALAVMIHMYYMPMVLAIMCASILHQLLQDRKNGKTTLGIVQVCFSLLIPILCTLGVMYLVGAFYGSPEIVQEGILNYSANLNTFYNPVESSSLLPGHPTMSRDQWEGYAYLGLGVFALLAIGLVGCLVLKRKVLEDKNFAISMAVLLVILGVYTFGPRITWNDIVLWTIPWPEPVMRLFSIFRVTGRYIWPMMYSIYLLAAVLVIRAYEKKVPVIILGAAVILQTVDLMPAIQEAISKGDPGAPSIIEDIAWQELGNHFDDIEFISSFDGEGDANELLTEYFSAKVVFDIADYACDYHMHLNDFYIGRRNAALIESLKYQHWQEIEQGIVDSGTVYVFNRIPFNLIQVDEINIYVIDELVIGVTSDYQWENEPADRIDKDYSINIMQEGLFISNGEDIDGCRILHPGGISFGPYIPLGSGKYRIHILGEKLDEVDVDVFSGSHSNTFLIENIQWDSDAFIYDVCLDETVYDIEFRVYNHQGEDIAIDRFYLELLEGN